MSNVVKDGNGNIISVASTTTGSGIQPLFSIADPSSGNACLVTQFHNSDGQSLGTVYGIMTGGVDQLINPSGTLDRKRGGFTTVQSSATGFANEVAMGIYNTSAPTVSNGNLVPLQTDASGNLKTNITNNVTLNYSTGSPLPISESGTGASVNFSTGLGTTPVQVKSGAGTIKFINFVNTSSTNWAFIKYWDAASMPTVGTTNIAGIFGIPPGGGNAEAINGKGIAFTNGLYIAATVNPVYTDTTAPATNAVVGTIGYN